MIHTALRCAPAVLCLALLLAATARPHRNWDMLPYAVAARMRLGDSADRAHEFVYAEVARALPAHEATLTNSGDFVRQVARDPRAMEALQVFYAHRIGYIAPVAALHAVGVPLFTATHLVSAVACALALLVALFSLGSHLTPGRQAVVFALALPLGALDVARLNTADGVAFLAMAVAAASWVHCSAWLAVTSVACVLARADLVLWSAMLGAAAMLDPDTRRVGLSATALSVATYALIVSAFETPSLPMVFAQTFSGATPFPREPPHGVLAHVARVIEGGLEALKSPAFLAYAALLTLLTIEFRETPRTRLLVLARIGCAYVAVRYLVFPAMWERFFILPWLLAALAVADALQSRSRVVR